MKLPHALTLCAILMLTAIGVIATNKSPALFAKITSDITEERMLHTTTLLANNKILVTGGQEHGPEPKSTMLYDIASNSWLPGPNTHVARLGHTATKLDDDTVLVVGGDGFYPPTHTSELYDPTINAWTVTSNTIEGRTYHAATLLQDGKVLVTGGLKAGGQIKSAEIYDPKTGKWSLTGSMTDARNLHASVLLPNGKVLVVGGFSGEIYLRSAELFDPNTEVWTPTGNMSQERAEHSLTLLPSGEVVVIAGSAGSSVYTLVEIYNPITGQWREAGNIGHLSVGHTATLLPDGRILVVGMADANNVSTAGIFDPHSGKWLAVSPPSRAFVRHTATMLMDGNLLLVGGFDVDGNLQGEYHLSELFNYRTAIDTEPPSGDFEINKGALATASRQVRVDIDADDAKTGVTAMQIGEACSTDSEWREKASVVEWQLSEGDGIKTVCVQLRDLAGNITLPITKTIILDTAAGSEYSISINKGALFTNRVQVTTTIGAKAVTAEMQISNDGGFAGVEWEPYTTQRAWQITQVGNNILPRVVYVRFRDVNGAVSSLYQDDIVLDINAPTGSVTIGEPDDSEATTSYASVTLLLSASDDLSGVAEMQISDDPELLEVEWLPFATSMSWELDHGQVFVRFRDNAGNISETYSTEEQTGALFLPTINNQKPVSTR